MSRQVTVCSAGECNGECYRCRLKATAQERDKFIRLTLKLYDAGIVTGHYGPWSDQWSEEDREIWERLQELRERVA